MSSKDKIKKITKLVIAEMHSRNEKKADYLKDAGILDWGKKFVDKIPTKEEAKKYILGITKEEIEKAYKTLKLKQDKKKVSFDWKKTVMILLSLAVLNGGVMPSDASAACNEFECEIVKNNIKYFADIRVREVKGLMEAKDLAEAKDLIWDLAESGKTSVNPKKMEKINFSEMELYADEGCTDKIKDIKKLKSLDLFYLAKDKK